MKAVSVLVGLLLVWPTMAGAEWVVAKAERVFPAEVSEADACRNAEERAREEAVRQITGERLSSEELMACTEQGAQAECNHNSVVWTMVDGDVRTVRNRQVETSAVVEGVRRCTVTLEADVVVANGKLDPNFDLGIRLNSQLLRDGEPLEIRLNPSQRMAVTVFQWLPYEKGERQVSRLFPNAYDPAVMFDHPATIPSDAGKQRYGMRVGFPEGMAANRRMVDEYLMVVATRQPVTFLDNYTLDDFRARLIELPRSDSRIVRKAYSIVRRTP